MAMPMIELMGEYFGKLYVLGVSPKVYDNKIAHWLCKCDCGNEVEVRSDNLRSGHTMSCGCANKRRFTHGMTGTLTYNSWAAMKQRCLNYNSVDWPMYGGRGIYILETRWIESFEEFVKDMGERPMGHTLDRIDNYKGYCKENCRWATYREQARNRR